MVVVFGSESLGLWFTSRMLDHLHSEGDSILHCMDAWFRFVPMPVLNSRSETVMGYLAPLVGSIDSRAVAAAMIRRGAGSVEKSLECFGEL